MAEPKPKIEKGSPEEEKSKVDAKLEELIHKREIERKYGSSFLERAVKLHERKRKAAEIEAFIKPKRIREEKKEEKKEIEEIQKKLGIKGESPKKEEEEEEKKQKIWEAVKEFGGIPEEELKEFDDLGDKPEDWQAREEELKEGRKEVISTVARIKSERARKFLTETVGLGKKEKQKYWRVISAALIGNDTPWADEIREWLREDKELGKIWRKLGGIFGIGEGIRGGINAKIFTLFGLNKSETGFNLRKWLDKVLSKGFYLPADLLGSEIGVSAENPTKKRLLEELGNLFPADAILSLWGDGSPEAQKMVEKYYKGDKRLKWVYEKYKESIKEKS